jgi:hypothetical protein
VALHRGRQSRALAESWRPTTQTFSTDNLSASSALWRRDFPIPSASTVSPKQGSFPTDFKNGLLIVGGYSSKNCMYLSHTLPLTSPSLGGNREAWAGRQVQQVTACLALGSVVCSCLLRPCSPSGRALHPCACGAPGCPSRAPPLRRLPDPRTRPASSCPLGAHAWKGAGAEAPRLLGCDGLAARRPPRRQPPASCPRFLTRAWRRLLPRAALERPSGRLWRPRSGRRGGAAASRAGRGADGSGHRLAGADGSGHRLALGTGLLAPASVRPRTH